MRFSYWDRKWIEEKCDVIIVGAGITGLSTALAIAQQHRRLSIRVVDRLSHTRLASTRNAGFSCFGSPTEIWSDIESFGEDATLELVEKRWKGMKAILQHFSSQSIDYIREGGFELIPNVNLNRSELMDKIQVLNDLLFPILQTAPFSCDSFDSGWPFAKSQYIVKNALEGGLNPAKYIKALMMKCQQLGVEIWQNVNVLSIDSEESDVKLITSLGNMRASSVVLATNGAFGQLALPDIEILPARNLILVSDKLDVSFPGVFHAEEGYIYFRMINKRLLIGGGRHWDQMTETTDEFGINEKILKGLKSYVKEKIFPNYHHSIKFPTCWSGIMGFNKNKLPLIRPVNRRVYVAAGFGGMGVALGMQSGFEVADLLLKNKIFATN